MASKACALCLRSAHRSTASIPRTANRFNYVATRSFTRQDIFQGELQDPKANKKSSITSATSKKSEANAKPIASKMSIPLKAAKGMQKTAGEYTEVYTAYGSTETLYKQCSIQADYSIPQAKDEDAEMPKTEDGEDLGIGEGWWHTDVGLKPTFSTWSQVTMLHMYLLVVRFRCFDSYESQTWQQHLLDHFFYDAEKRMTIDHNMYARGTRNKYLKDMFIQWRGLLAAYDEGIQKGDAVLASAIWRNVFKANEDIDLKALAQIVSYMRSTLKGLESITDSTLMTQDIRFTPPEEELELVERRSPSMDLPFEAKPDKKLPPGFQKTKQ